MKSRTRCRPTALCPLMLLVTFVPLVLTANIRAQSNVDTASSAPVQPTTYATPQEAVAALIDAAEKFDLPAFEKIFGSEGKKIVLTGETARDREIAAALAEQARLKQRIVLDAKDKNRAILYISDLDWPFAVPIIKKSGKWSFDAEAGRKDLIFRRIMANELDAIEFCRGYVEAQRKYALQKRGESGLEQYAQKVFSTTGKQDGLAWRNPDGTWGGPVGEKVARAIERGYITQTDLYHGYYFRVLKGQGPAAPQGAKNFVVEGAMTGGFAIAAVPAKYGITGVRSFIVSHDGIVYEKDLGSQTLDIFKSMELYNPDKTWHPVE